MNKERTDGFYWCNIGTTRGKVSGWAICFYDSVFNNWIIPTYGGAYKDADMVEIDENKIPREWQKNLSGSCEGWIPCSERQPEVDELVNICNVNDEWACSGHFKEVSKITGRQIWVNQYSIDVVYPTHWMPILTLPSKPQASSK